MALSMSKESKKSLKQTVDHVLGFFVEAEKLEPIEVQAHLHGGEGYMNMTVSGWKLVGAEEYSPQETLAAIVQHVRDTYGLTIEHYGVHLHAPGGAAQGYVQVTCTATDPVEIHIQTDHLEAITRQFFKDAGELFPAS